MPPKYAYSSTNTEENLENLSQIETTIQEKQNLYLNFHISEKYNVQVYKPLIGLKVVLFLWFTAAISARSFMAVFYKQRGITIEEFSLMHTLMPIIQILCTTSLGVIADRIGRVKPILLINLTLCIVTAIILISMPSAERAETEFQSLLPCQESDGIQKLVENIPCNISNETILSEICNGTHSVEDCIGCNEIVTVNCELSKLQSLNSLPPILQNKSLNKNLQSQVNNFFSIKQNYTFYICGQHVNISCTIHYQEKNNHDSSLTSNNRNFIVMGYGIAHLIFLVTNGNMFRFIDITTMISIKYHNSDYGRQKFWGVLGAVCGPLLSSSVIQISALYYGRDNYAAIFYSYIILNIVILIIIYKMDIKILEPGKKMWKKTFALGKNPNILFFYFILMICGSAWGYQTSIRSWYFKDLGAKSYIIGLVESCNYILALPFFFVSKWYVERIGYSNIFILALLSRAISLFSYSFLKTAWPALFLSLTEIVGNHLFWVGVNNYCYDIAPKGLVTTVNAVAGTTHYSIGATIGILIGGMVMGKYGGRVSFRVMGSMCLSMMVVYVIYLVLKRRFNK